MAKKDRKCTRVLVNYRANATMFEPATGMSALTTAFTNSHEVIAKLLLQYGADHDVVDAKGNTARSLAKKPGMKALLDLWDQDGAMALEV